MSRGAFRRSHGSPSWLHVAGDVFGSDGQHVLHRDVHVTYVRFKATLEDGSVVIGTIQGNGGMVGAGASHLRFDEQCQVALQKINGAQRVNQRNRASGLYEPTPGHFAMYPQCNAESNGEMVSVPIRGTRFELVGGKRR
jgi:hypothetical protein